MTCMNECIESLFPGIFTWHPVDLSYWFDLSPSGKYFKCILNAQQSKFSISMRLHGMKTWNGVSNT